MAREQAARAAYFGRSRFRKPETLIFRPRFFTMVLLAEKAKLRTDATYLANRVCTEFKKYDTYNRGLITAAGFSRVLEDLGLKYGQREVDEIMRYCVITNDGYVHYKDLIKLVSPATPRAQQCTAKHAIFPNAGADAADARRFAEHQEEGSDGAGGGRTPTNAPLGPATNARDPCGLREYITDRVEDVRRAYARWDRGVATDAEFKEILQTQLGIPLTDAFERMLSVHGPSRNLSFSKLMHSLQIEDFVQRKARDPTMAAHHAAAFTGGSRLAQNPPRNPVTWNDRQRQHMPDMGNWGYPAAGGPPASSAPEGSPSQQGSSPARSQTGGAGMQMSMSRGERLHVAICEFVDGRVPSLVFRAQLERCGVMITGVLDRLIRRHESDNSTQFKDFAREIFRNTRMEDVPGTGDRPIDFDDLRIAPPQIANQDDDRPYASGGAWSQDGRSSTAERGGDHENGNADGGQAEDLLRMHTPFATDFNVEGINVRRKQETEEDQQEGKTPSGARGRRTPKAGHSRSAEPPRAAGCAGDIISWREDMGEDFTGPPTQEAARRIGNETWSGASKRRMEQNLDMEAPSMPGWRTNGDIITWSHQEVGAREEKLGKRYYGRVLDTYNPPPFGTDQNMKGHDPWLSKSEFRPAMI